MTTIAPARGSMQLFGDLARRAVDVAASLGAQWADARVGLVETEDLGVRNGAVRALERTETSGFGVRVLLDGAHGFASGCESTEAEVERVARLAVAIAREGRRAGP